MVSLPGVMKYGQTRADTIGKVEALALRVLAERIEAGEDSLESLELRFAAARALSAVLERAGYRRA